MPSGLTGIRLIVGSAAQGVCVPAVKFLTALSLISLTASVLNLTAGELNLFDSQCAAFVW